jgi:hypothetical protein
MKYQKRKRNRCPLGDTNVWEARKEVTISVGVNTRYFAGGTKTSKITWS